VTGGCSNHVVVRKILSYFFVFLDWLDYYIWQSQRKLTN